MFKILGTLLTGVNNTIASHIPLDFVRKQAR